jgi:hypothetical protein
LSAWDKIKKDPRYVYLLTAAIIILSPYMAFQIPLNIDPPVADFVASIEALNPGDNIYISNSLGSTIIGETLDPQIVIIKYMLEKDLDIIFYSTSPDGDAIGIQTLEAIMGVPYQDHPWYGENIIDLGYVPGGATAILSHSNGIRDLNPVDRFGTSLDVLPAANNFNTANDMDLIFGSGAGPLNTFPAVLTVPYNLPTLYLYHSGGAAMMSINYVAGQAQGYIAGVGQGAQLELLTGVKGNNQTFQVAITLVSLLALSGLIVSNVYYLAVRGRRTEVGE